MMTDVSVGGPVPETTVVDPVAENGTDGDREMNITDTVEGQGKQRFTALCSVFVYWLIKKNQQQQIKADVTRPVLPAFHQLI